MRRTDREVTETVERQLEESYERAADSDEAASRSAAQTNDVTAAATTANAGVPMGTTTTLSNMTLGDAGGQFSGIVPRFSGSNYDTSADTATASIVAGPAGIGTGVRWSWIGTKFTTGSGSSRSATIITRGRYNGQLSALGAGQSEVALKLVVKGGGSTYQTKFFSNTLTGFLARNLTSNFSRGLSLVLQPNTTYTVLTQIETKVTIATLTEAGSDFGPQDGDKSSNGESQRVAVDDIVVQF